MRTEEFEEVVAEALEGLPEEIQNSLENVAVLVQDWPSREQLRSNGITNRYGLLGLYEGIPLTDRDTGYGMVLPDRISIFQKPLEAAARSHNALLREIRDTVVHEVAHHFGFSDEDLHRMGL